MRLRNPPSPLVLLLLTSAVVAAISSTGTTGDSSSAKSKSKYDVGTKDAPVDGMDGKPHEGPFVNSGPKGDASVDDIIASSDEYAYLASKASDSPAPTATKAGVMDDKHRDPPKQGTTGTEGGVSEKDKLRKAKEDQTGEKAKKLPEPPKATPPRPDIEKDKLAATAPAGDGKESTKDGKDGDFPNIQVR